MLSQFIYQKISKILNKITQKFKRQIDKTLIKIFENTFKYENKG